MTSPPTPAIWWVRRDLRLGDNPALLAAISAGSAVLPLFVRDPVLLRSAGPARMGWLMAALRNLDDDLRAGGGPGLSVVEGRPSVVLPQVAQAVGARSVHIAADFAPYGSLRDAAVGAALGRVSVELTATGSPYAVAPGTLVKADGTPFQVFTPFHRTWLTHGVHPPAAAVDVGQVSWVEAEDLVRLTDDDPELTRAVGEARALELWRDWLERDRNGADDYLKM
ncbi:MAG TPA: deoxyribodipyrimidine photo-lyase, partial [Propionibacteriaceae bacterium]